MTTAEMNTTVQAVKNALNKIGDTSDLNEVVEEVQEEQDGLTILKGIYESKIQDKNNPLNGSEIKKLLELYEAAEKERDEERGDYDDDGRWVRDTRRFEIMYSNAEREVKLVADLMGVDIMDIIYMVNEYNA